MTTTETWWEEIFEGNLSLGINKERLSELEDENFLYFTEEEDSTEHLHS
ncbi:hypothetical protein [Sporosarcina jiandibaonis]|jgi:hypothetical protein|nr:hypothetical protein [Sporosarcina jiandibaonis]